MDNATDDCGESPIRVLLRTYDAWETQTTSSPHQKATVLRCLERASRELSFPPAVMRSLPLIRNNIRKAQENALLLEVPSMDTRSLLQM